MKLDYLAERPWLNNSLGLLMLVGPYFIFDRFPASVIATLLWIICIMNGPISSRRDLSK